MRNELKKKVVKEFSLKDENVEYNSETGFYLIKINHPKNYTILKISFDDEEITLGFTGDDWHIHLDFPEAQDETEKIEKIVEFIKEIVEDKKLIAFSSKHGEWLTDDPEDDLSHKDPDEKIEFGYWSKVKIA